MTRSAPIWLTLVLACAPTQPELTGDTTTDDVGATGTTDAVVTTGAHELPPAAVHLRLDLADHGPTGALIGWNIGRGSYYAPAGDPLHPEWRTPVMTAAVARLAEVRAADRPPQVRFSGLQIDGALGGDGYHFFKWVDPERVALPDDNMASFEYFALIDEIGGDPLITVNFGSGTAQEAADYVTHLAGTDPADPLVAARIAWGREAPYDVAHFELGNEIYGFWNTGYTATGKHSYANPEAPSGGDPPWHGKPSSDPADYAARAREYVAAVLAVAPDARFWVPLSQAPMDAWGGTTAALSALTPLLAEPAVEAVVVHHYQVDDGVTLGLVDRDDPAFLLGGSEAFRAGYVDLQARLAALPRPLALAVTEYHVAGAFSHGNFERADQAVVGLGIADILIMFAQIDVAHAAQHMALGFGDPEDPLFEPWYNPLRADGDAVIAMPSLVVTRLISDHMLPRRAVLESVAQEMLPDLTLATTTVAVPAVHAVAFAAEDGKAATIVALHRDLQASRDLTLDLPSGWTVDAASQYAPAAIDLDARSEPVDVTPLMWQQVGARVQLTLAPHSVIALRLAAS